MLADKKALTLAVVKRIAAAAEQEAVKNNWNIFIAIVDDGGNLMYLERMDDSQLGSQEVSVQKARSALLFKRPTKALEDAVAGGRNVIMSLANAAPDFRCWPTARSSGPSASAGPRLHRMGWWPRPARTSWRKSWRAVSYDL